jgi:hypothetical protein
MHNTAIGAAHLLCRPSTPHLLLQNSEACLMMLHFLHCFCVTVGCGCCSRAVRTKTVSQTISLHLYADCYAVKKAACVSCKSRLHTNAVRTCFMPALRQPLHLLLSWSALRSSRLKSLTGLAS